MPLFSIIVPVYNVENYLEECLDSILIQTFDDYEVIIINDGSTDNSLHLCYQYEKKSEKIKVYTQENQGLAAARNAGVKKSSGQYLIFVDSDDYFSNNLSLKKIADSIKSDTELVIYSLTRTTGIDKYYKNYIDCFLNLPSDVDSGERYIMEMKKGSTSYFLFSTCMAYSRKYWEENDFCFPEQRAYEDFGLIWKVICRAKRIEVLREILYVYRIDRPGSITKRFSEQEVILHTKMLNNNVLSMKKESLSKELEESLMSIFSSGYFGYLIELSGYDFEMTPKTETFLEDTFLIFKNCKNIPKHVFVSIIISAFGINKGLKIIGRIRHVLHKVSVLIHRQ